MKKDIDQNYLDTSDFEEFSVNGKPYYKKLVQLTEQTNEIVVQKVGSNWQATYLVDGKRASNQIYTIDGINLLITAIQVNL